MSWWTRTPDPLVEAVKSLVETQARMAEAVMKSVESITATQAKQADAITAHLSLFKMAEPPSSAANVGAEENKAWAEQNGFPFEGSAEEIANWIEKHDTDD